MSQPSPEKMPAEMLAILRPDGVEVTSRLLAAYNDFHEEVHQRGAAHSPEELMSIDEHKPSLRGNERYRTCVTIQLPDRIGIILPLSSPKPFFSAQLEPTKVPEEASLLHESLVVATTLEELTRSLRAGTARAIIKHFD